MSAPESEPIVPAATPAPESPPDRDLDAPRALLEEALVEVKRVIAGQDEMLERVLVCLVAGGHLLIEGVPGLAKTLTIKTTAAVLGGSFRRIQFTPDMMPSDITSTDILQDDPETGRRRFTFIAGPLFAHIILADEINRTPPKTQAALLEAMQERHVTAGGTTYPLPDPFFVLATQNPIEQEGTYPLPEAQLDRFMLNVLVPYPSADEELEILRRTTGDELPAEWSATVQFAVSVPPTLGLGLLLEGPTPVERVWPAVGSVLFLAVVNSVMGLLLIVALVRTSGAAASSSVA